MPITNQQRRVLKQMLEKEREGIERGYRQSDEEIPESVIKAIIAQNFIRNSLEVAIEGSLPFQMRFIAELAVRAASLVISAAPIEKQDELIAILLHNLRSVHHQRVAAGEVIKLQWEVDGHLQPNVATGNEVN